MTCGGLCPGLNNVIRELTQSLCSLSSNFGTDDEGSMSRPFGVALLVAGHDADEASPPSQGELGDEESPRAARRQ